MISQWDAGMCLHPIFIGRILKDTNLKGEIMNTKNKGLIATIAAVVLCGCPGLFMCFMGAMYAFVGSVPGADIDINGSSDPSSAITLGISLLCVSIIFIAIPVAVGFFTMRKKPAASGDEPLPPVS